MRIIFIVLLFVSGIFYSFYPVPDELPSKEKTTGKLSDSYMVRTYPDLYYEIQIASLNSQTSIDLFYDEEVQYYIDLFLYERTEKIREMAVFSYQYLPLFEQFMKTYRLPEELKYLPALESGFSPFACSPSMAKGLWQFKEQTGKSYGLSIDEFYDEREDPVKSTDAACRYLLDLYKKFNSWHLALLAYNSGPTAVETAVRKAHYQKDYRNVYPYLTEPAKKYIPAFIALFYLMNNYQNHFYHAAGS